MTGAIKQTASAPLVAELNALDEKKQDTMRRLHGAKEEARNAGMSAKELRHAFRQAREMLKAGTLPNVRALIARYVHKVTVSGKVI
jgi:predicted kinase